MSFLTKILPTEGLYCVAMAYPKGGFKHYFFKTVEQAQAQIDLLDTQGRTVFLAQATFKTSDSRKQENTAFLRNFFFDIDCGPGKDYPDKKEAVQALKAFISETGLPFPAVVSSGNGLYAHWPLEENVVSTSWKTIARILKDTAVAYGFKTDPMRTADSASVLRPIGATHRKDPQNLKTVMLLKDAEPIRFMDFVQALTKAAKKKKVNTAQAQAPKAQKDLNSEFTDGLVTSLPSSIERVADKCLQFGEFRKTKWQAGEPHWYTSLGVMVFCEDGPERIQEWSSGNPKYNYAETEAKAKQYLNSGVGPSTCAQFGIVNPEGCIGCPHNG
ncbi:MAG: hypothetical protein GQ578_02375, partial [Desulfuromonadaceae bacterium]|nr:hypothetical protein [Desulfuromonadaceae bacterium]